MTDGSENDFETKINYHDSEEVNAQACKQIEYDELPFVLITKSELDSEKPFNLGLVMGNGIDSLMDARDLLLLCLDQVDLAMLEYGDQG
jgi:hypothetical protein